MGWLKRLFSAEPLKLPEPAWDGVHRLKKISYHEEAAWPDDYHSGYQWFCTCSMISRPLPPFWYSTEKGAAMGWGEHASTWQEFAPDQIDNYQPHGHTG